MQCSAIVTVMRKHAEGEQMTAEYAEDECEKETKARRQKLVNPLAENPSRLSFQALSACTQITGEVPPCGLLLGHMFAHPTCEK